MKVQNKSTNQICYARATSTGWATIYKGLITFYTESEFTNNFIIL